MKITFDNIAGYLHEKQEALNLCKTILNYKDYSELGISLPKGLLMYGPPGVGKTLFARAIANEIGRSFIEVDFASKSSDYKDLIKEKFQEAKEKSPSIIFIDEIDKFIPEEDLFREYKSDKTRETQAMLLSLLDGFDKDGEIMVIATVNHIRKIPDALIRPGRVDKHIGLSLPDEQSRREIISYYLNQIKLEKEIDINQVLLISDGMSGADIKTMINEAAILAINNNTNIITTRALMETGTRIDLKQLIHFDKPSENEEEDKIIAYHELGHFIVANKLNQTIKDVSIISDPTSAGRARMRPPSKVLTTNDLFNQAVIALGGRAAEEIMLNNKYTGSHHDILSAYQTIEYSIYNGDYGFEYVHKPTSKIVTEEKQQKIIDKTNELMEIAYKQAFKIVKDNKDIIEKIHPILLKEKSLTGIQLSEFVEGKIEKDSNQNNEEDLEYASYLELSRL